MDDEKKLQSGADFSDYAIAQKSPEEIGYPFLRGAQGLPAEAQDYQDDTISNYEEANGVPYTAVMLGYGQHAKIDPQVELKIWAVDEHIRKTMADEGVRDSKVGYKTIYTRLTQDLEGAESAKNHNTMTRLLDTLFMRVALANRVSSKTYLQKVVVQHEHVKTDRALKRLKTSLNMK